MSQPPRPHTAVAGLQWGDEGKGKIVDHLAADYDLVVRYNGGANAGHTVVTGGRRFALHLVPCGVLHPGRTGVIANGVVVDPDVLLGEIADLRSAGVEVGANLVISDRAHVVMPYHKTADGLVEAAMAAALGEGRQIGTTGRGIGPCYADKATRTTAVRVGDLVDLPALRRRLPLIAAVKNASLKPLAEMAGQEWTPVDPDQLADACAAWSGWMAEHVADTSRLLSEALAAARRVLFEGANGFLLDVDHGTYPYVTSSNASVLGVFAGAGVPGATVGDVLGVVKAYQTRVGHGPFPTEQDNAAGQRLRDRGHEYGTTTGRPRRCGWLDLFAVGYAARTSGVTALAVTLLDVLAGFDELPVCLGYEIDAGPAESFPARTAELARAVPVYRTLPGFGDEISGCRTYSDLPAEARRYVEAIEQIVGLPVRLVSVGPDREQTLARS
jgi:adenylosuccinate synthase